MLSQEWWSVISLGVAALCDGLSIGTSKLWQQRVLKVGSNVGLLLGGYLLVASARDAVVERVEKASEVEAATLDQINRTLLRQQERVVKVGTYPEFAALIAAEVPLNSRWYVTRLMTQQQPPGQEEGYFDALSQSLSKGHLTDHRRLVRVWSDAAAARTAGLLQAHSGSEALQIRIIKEEGQRASFELIVGDEIAIIMLAEQGSDGPPSHGFVLRGRDVANSMALVFDQMWQEAADQELKGRYVLDEPSLREAIGAIYEAVPRGRGKTARTPTKASPSERLESGPSVAVPAPNSNPTPHGSSARPTFRNGGEEPTVRTAD
ncbi:MAG: hypothetical protein NTV21_11155 [Planctomycetota bacterium]|nr:hypothetical protein [Planctomycetota bacterium]